MSPYPEWRTLRELDTDTGQPKGAAFRAFKRLADAHTEGRDYLLLQPPRDRAAIEALRAQGRLYRGSVKAVLLERHLAESIRQALRTDPPESR